MKAGGLDTLGRDWRSREFADGETFARRRYAAPLNVEGLAKSEGGGHIVGVKVVGKAGGGVFAKAGRSGRIALGTTAGRNETRGDVAVLAGLAGKKMCKFLGRRVVARNYRVLHGRRLPYCF